MKKIFNSNFLTLFAILLGIIIGFIPFDPIFGVFDGISQLFINLLKLISLPMIFLAIVSTFTNLDNLSQAKIMVRKIFKYTILTTLLAAATGLLLFIFIKPAQMSAPLAASSEIVHPTSSYFSFLMKIIPSNPIEAFLENNVLAVAFIAVLLSVAILHLPKDQKKTLQPIFQSLFQALLKISTGIVAILPLGIFAFTVQFVRSIKSGDFALGPLLLYSLCVIGANLIQGMIILPLLLKKKGISPIKLFRAVSPALLSAFFSKSSNATLPLTLQCAEKRFGVHNKVAGFSLPLCSVINMNGCAAFILITVLFVSMKAGISYSIAQMIPWIFLASLAAIGNAGVPMGCFFLTSAFLISMHVPLTLLGMILPLYTFFDMIETALNVWSDCCVTAMADKPLRKVLDLPITT